MLKVRTSVVNGTLDRNYAIALGSSSVSESSLTPTFWTVSIRGQAQFIAGLFAVAA